MPYQTEYHCPKCHGKLISDGEAVWCTLVSTRLSPGCDYGISERVTTQQHLAEDVDVPIIVDRQTFYAIRREARGLDRDAAHVAGDALRAIFCPNTTVPTITDCLAQRRQGEQEAGCGNVG